MVQRVRSPYDGSISRIEGILAGLYDLINSIAPGASIKSIQRGTIAIGGTSATATITSVDTTKTELRMLGFIASIDRLDIAPYIVLTDATTITATRAVAAGGTTVSWELTEYN